MKHHIDHLSIQPTTQTNSVFHHPKVKQLITGLPE